MKSEQEIDEITDTLIDFGVKMTMAALMMKVISDSYKENPNMFWAYKKSKLRNIVYNCRM